MQIHEASTNEGIEDEAPARWVALVASNQTLVREGVKALIAARSPDAQFVDIEDVRGLTMAAGRWPDARLALVDLCMPGLRDGVVVRELSDRFPQLGVVALGGSLSPAVLRRVAQLASVCAVLPRHANLAALGAAIDAVRQGRRLGISQDPASQHSRAILTPRQQDIAKLLRQGLSNKAIAVRLNISEGTVKNHVTDVLRVLNVANRAQAARLDLEIE